tara:strand:+ start:965 stop:1384 length:420 start_codon:yes stop_codon:yes gene_type:complete
MTRDSAALRSHCPINFVAETFGDRWTLLIIRDLMFWDKRSYGAFLESDEGISTNILADRLKRLEDHGLISKSVDPENRTRHIYALTQKGLDFLPVMVEIAAWSGTHDALSSVPKDFMDAYRANRDGLTAFLQARAVKES